MAIIGTMSLEEVSSSRELTVQVHRIAHGPLTRTMITIQGGVEAEDLEHFLSFEERVLRFALLILEPPEGTIPAVGYGFEDEDGKEWLLTLKD